MMQQLKRQELEKALAFSVMPVIAWYLVDYLARSLNWLFWDYVSTGQLDFQPHFFVVFLGDTTGWAEVLGKWPSLVLPLIIVLALALFRVRLTWRVGLAVGLAVLLSQWVTWALVLTFVKHKAILSPGIQFYLSRAFVVLPGPLAAVAASRVDLSQELGRA